MKVTKDNFKLISSHWLLPNLLNDLDELNNLLIDKRQIFIDWRDYHDEYSPERTDPCPDYYGYFSLRLCNKPEVMIGDYMTIDDLDSAICLLIEFVESEIG